MNTIREAKQERYLTVFFHKHDDVIRIRYESLFRGLPLLEASCHASISAHLWQMCQSNPKPQRDGRSRGCKWHPDTHTYVCIRFTMDYDMHMYSHSETRCILLKHACLRIISQSYSHSHKTHSENLLWKKYKLKSNVFGVSPGQISSSVKPSRAIASKKGIPEWEMIWEDQAKWLFHIGK